MAKGLFGMIKDFGKKIAKVFEGVTKTIQYIECSIRIIGNFQKCIFFYLLDVLKYVILFVPLIIVSFLTGFDLKTLKEVFAKIDSLLAWSATIQYDCYSCKKKNKKDDMSFWQKLANEFAGNQKSLSQHLFFFFFSTLIVVIFILFQIFKLLTQQQQQTIQPLALQNNNLLIKTASL